MSFIEKWFGLDEETKAAHKAEKEAAKAAKQKAKLPTKGITGVVELMYVELLGERENIWVSPEDAAKLIKPENVNKFVIVQEYDSKYLGSFTHRDESQYGSYPQNQHLRLQKVPVR